MFGHCNTKFATYSTEIQDQNRCKAYHSLYFGERLDYVIIFILHPLQSLKKSPVPTGKRFIKSEFTSHHSITKCL